MTQQVNRQPRLPFMLIFAIILQSMTNMLFLRSFRVAMGTLKGKGPTMLLQIRQVFGKNKSLIMDLHSFLEIAIVLANVHPAVLEKQGFIIPKHNMMSEDFVVPSWAFPRALFEMLMAARDVGEMMMQMQKSLSEVEQAMLKSGIAKEEVDKFVNHYKKQLSGTTKPAAEQPQEESGTDKPTLH